MRTCAAKVQLPSEYRISHSSQSTYFDAVALAAAGGLGDLRPVRQLVRFGAAAQIHPSSRLARSLWPEEQPEVLGATPRSIRHHLTAQAVHACARDRCGREHDDVSRAGRRGTVVESSL